MKKKGAKEKKAVKKSDTVKNTSVKESLAKKSRFSQKELEEYQESLLNLKDDLMKQIQEISEESLRKSQKEASGDIGSHSLHLADRASDAYERDFNLGLVSSEKRIVVEIDQALKRIEQNEFGFCQCCGKPITKQRLKAIPYARHRTKCQEEIEKQEQR